MLLIYDAKAFTEKCTFCLRFSTNAILMLISSSLEFHELLSVRTSAWLRSLAWIKSSICNQQLNWGFSTVLVFKAYPLFNTTTWKNTAKLYKGMWECILPFCLPLLPGLLGLFDLGLNSEQQQSRNQWDGWILIPREVRKPKLDHLLKEEKQDTVSGPSASAVAPNASCTQFCFSHQHWRAFPTWVIWFCSPPFLFYPKRSGLQTRNTLMSHMQEPAQIPFCIPAPPNGCVPSWLCCSSPQTTTTEQIILCKAVTEGPVKSSSCVNIS